MKCLRRKSEVCDNDFIKSQEYIEIVEQLNVQKGVRACCSAPQFGVNKRIIAFTDVILEKDEFQAAVTPSMPYVNSWYVYMNPRITAKSQQQIENVEHSASIPFLIGRVKRLGSIFVHVQWLLQIFVRKSEDK